MIGDFEDGNEDKGEDEDKEEFNQQEDEPFRISGRQGLFTKTISMHQKYASRPIGVENLTLSQFATSYTKCQKLPERYVFHGNVTKELGNIVDHLTDNRLPLYIKLSTGEIYRLRKFSTVLRMHSSSKKDGDEELYAEMQLFSPWRPRDLEFWRLQELEVRDKAFPS